MDARVQVVWLLKKEKKSFYHSKNWRTPCSNSEDPLGVPDPLLKTPVIGEFFFLYFEKYANHPQDNMGNTISACVSDALAEVKPDFTCFSAANASQRDTSHLLFSIIVIQ